MAEPDLLTRQALAVTAKADALISGDKDLLALSDNSKIPILTPAAFKERFDSEQQSPRGA